MHYHNLNTNTDIHILLGPNGSGKTTSLRTIKHELDSKHNPNSTYDDPNPLIRRLHTSNPTIPVLYYGSDRNDISKTTSDITLQALTANFLSEGEHMCTSFSKWFTTTWYPYLQDPSYHEMYVLIDELDSGLSLDRIKHTIDQLHNIHTIETTKYNRKINIIFTANSYELLESIQRLFKNNTVYWLPSHKQVIINSYQEFSKLYNYNYTKLRKGDKNNGRTK